MFDDSLWSALGAVAVLVLLGAAVIFGFAFDVDREKDN